MKQTFYIDGITCMSCVAKLKEFYIEKQGVSEVEIEKESGKVTLSTNQKLSEATLSDGLAEKYTFKGIACLFRKCGGVEMEAIISALSDRCLSICF
jgi:copper chaperone CopZ